MNFDVTVTFASPPAYTRLFKISLFCTGHPTQAEGDKMTVTL